MTQVVIVGAGVVGLMCALRLAKEGARVTLLESDPDDRDVFRPGASAAAAGMLAPFDVGGGPHHALALASFDLWRAWTPGSAWAEGVRFDGAVIAASSESDAAALQASAMHAKRQVAPLSPQQADKRAGLKGGFAHALFVEDEGVADPLWTLSGLTLEARGHGVSIVYDQDVSAARAHHVETYTGEIYEADHVVLAPGAWASEELMKAAPALKRVRPAKGHLVSVKTTTTLKANLHTPGFYMARRRDEVVLGASMQLDRYDRGVEQGEVQKLLAAAEAAAPGAATPTGRAWAGIRPMSPDGWPMIGRSSELLVAAGHSRHGWLLAPITAELITAYVFGAEIPPAWAALAPQRFEP